MCEYCHAWDLVLKKNLLKSVITSPVNSARDSQKKHKHAKFSFLVQSKPMLTKKYVIDLLKNAYCVPFK